MAVPRSALPGQTQGLFGEILRKSAMESGGDPMKRIQLMQDYMGQATPQVLEATGRETTRRQGKEVARAGVQAKTEAAELTGNEQLAMNRRISEEANSVAKQTALISAGATLLGQMATVKIPEWKKQKAEAKKKEAEALSAPEPLLKILGQVATGEVTAPARSLAWPEGLDPKSKEARTHVLDQFFGGMSEVQQQNKFDEWAAELGTKAPRNWKQAFEMLSAQQEPLTPAGEPPKPVRRPVGSRPGWSPRPPQQKAEPLPPPLRLRSLDESLRPSPVLELSPEQLLHGAQNPLFSKPPGIPGIDRPTDPVGSFGYGGGF